MATWVLKFISGKYQGQEFTLQPGQDYTVGRSSDSSLILVEDMVSRNHARIFIQGEGVRLEDLGSTNGSFVNGERVRDADLHDGDRILFGTSIIKLVRVDEDAVPTGTLPRTFEGSPALPRFGVEGPSANRGGPAAPATMAMQAIAVPPAGAIAPPGPAAPPRAAVPAPSPVPPVPAPTHVSRPTVASAIAGMLEEVSLGDLLQLFSTSRKSGVLRIEGPHNGAVHLRDGRIVFAEIYDNPELHPEKAAYRILTWDKGNFVLEPAEQREFPIELEYGTEGLLMESMRLLDEMENLRGKLPRDAQIAIKRPIVPPLRALTPELLDTLQLVINFGLVSAVLDRSLGTDLETMQDLGYLLKHGYIEQVMG